MKKIISYRKRKKVSIEKEKKIEEYQTRFHFWTDKRTSQLSFFNNLLLTISIAIIGYIWKEDINFYLDLNHMKMNITLLALGLISSGLSVGCGLLLAISRLYDLRLTSNIMLTRKRALKKDIKLDEKRENRPFYSSLKNVFFNYDNYKIESEDIDKEKLEKLNDKFIELRELSESLGTGTWKLLNYQIGTFLFSIIYLLASVLWNK